jgi:uncharacterized GH25 family protein
MRRVKMKKIKTIMIALVLTMFSIQMAFAQSTVSGTVSGAVVENVLVRIESDEITLSTSTAANGTYSIIDVPNGIYSIKSVALATFVPRSRVVRVNDADIPNMDFVSTALPVDPPSTGVYGYVSGDIQEGVTIIIWELNCGATEPFAVLTTDADGFWEYVGLADGQWLLNVEETDWMYLPKDPLLSYDFTAILD